MKYYFPPKDQNYTYLQTNRSDDLGSLWSSFNLDFQSNLGAIRLSPKLVTNTTSSDDADLGCPSAFDYFDDRWFAICGTKIFSNSSELITGSFTEDTSKYSIGDSTTRFDITEPVADTIRYTYDGTGTNPSISATTFPIGALLTIDGENFNANNNGNFIVTGSGANYFEVLNPTGVAENDKTIGNGYISVYGGTIGATFSTNVSDLALFDDRLWATTTTQLYSKESNSGVGKWTLRDTIGSGSVHKLTYFKKFDRLYYSDTDTKISSINTSNTPVNSLGDYFIDLGTTVSEITTIASSYQYIWIGLLKINNSSTGYGVTGSIGQWDGISAQLYNEYPITSAGVLAIVVLNDIPYAIDSEGRVLEYTGYSFKEFARLPIDRILLTRATTSGGNDRFVHFNGMVATKNNTLLVSINNLNDDDDETVNENLSSGIWELDLETRNFTHKQSFGLKSLSSSTITDYGQNKISQAGAIKLNTLGIGTSSSGRSTILAGATYFTDATTTKSAIFIDSPKDRSTDTEGQKRGYYITTWFNSDEVEDKFARLWDIHKRFLTSTDKIVYKYRLIEEDPVLATITWTSTTTFTTTTNVSAYSPTATGFNGTTGGEVEILQGTGGGSCTHISSISELAGTYTVTLDTAVTGVTGTAKARFQKWIKMYPDVTGLVKSYENVAIGANNTQIQIKCCMEFTGDMEFQRFILTSNEDIKATL